MRIEPFKDAMQLLFSEPFKQFDEGDEYALYTFGPDTIRRIGYSTNMTPELVRQAADQKVNLIVTHHDAWDFVYGMKEECHSLLREHQIHHFFVHLPLDYAEFGTCHSLFQALGVNTVLRPSCHHEGRSLPGIGEFASPVSFEELGDRVRHVLQEDVKAWKNSQKPIKRIGLLTGAGHSTSYIRDAHQAGCDVYITSEKILYTVQYAQFIGMNLIVGSHTFTEIFGVRALAEKIKTTFPGLEIVRLHEPHIE